MNSPVTGTEIFWAMAAVIVLLLIVVAKAISVANHHAGAARAAAVQAASVVAQAQQPPRPGRRTGRGGRLLMAAGVAGAGLWLALGMHHSPPSGAQHPHAQPTAAPSSPQPGLGHSAPAHPRATHAPGPSSPLTGTEIVILVAIVSVTTIPIALARRSRDG